MQRFFEALHFRSDFRFRAIGVGIYATAHPIRASLDTGSQVRLLHIAESVTQLG